MFSLSTTRKAPIKSSLFFLQTVKHNRRSLRVQAFFLYLRGGLGEGAKKLCHEEIIDRGIKIEEKRCFNVQNL